MTTIIKATLADGRTFEAEALLPASLDPRFDFAREDASLELVQAERIQFAAGLLGGAVRSIRFESIDHTEPDLQLAAEQPRRTA